MSDTAALEGLTSHYASIIKDFLSFGRHQTELGAREIEQEFRNVRDSRLLSNDYTDKEVRDILKDLQGVLQATLRKETKNCIHTATELLRQVFKEADNVGFTLTVDVSSIESEESLTNISKLEDKLFTKPTNTPSKLPSLGGNSMVSAEEVVKLRTDNQNLREKLTDMQKTYTSMMKEKSETTVKSNLYKDQIEELKEQIEELKQNNQNQAKEQDGLLQETAKQLEKVKLESSEQDTKRSETEDRIRELLEQNQKLQAQLEERKVEVREIKKELGERINETQQFQNMKKILTTKNQQLKELRDKLNKYEPTQDD